MGSRGGATLNRVFNRVAGTPRGSYRSQGNTFNWDIEIYMGGSGGATFNRVINRVAGTPRGSYRSPGNIFNVEYRIYKGGSGGAIRLIEAFIELKVHQEVATDLRVTYLMGI